MINNSESQQPNQNTEKKERDNSLGNQGSEVSFSYQNIPSVSKASFKIHKLRETDSQMKTQAEHLKSPIEEKKKSVEELYLEAETMGVNEEDAVVKKPYFFKIQDSWNAACRKEVIRLLRNRIKATDFSGHGVTVGCCYPCIKPLDEQIIDEMR